MKKSKFTEEQILFALKQGDAGQPMADVCRQMGISEATYYVWKKKCAHMGLLEVRRFHLGSSATNNGAIAYLNLFLISDAARNTSECFLDVSIQSISTIAILLSHAIDWSCELNALQTLPVPAEVSSFGDQSITR